MARELYGETAQKYGMSNNYRDGALIAQNVDWKNVNERAIENRETQLKSEKLDAKDRRYQNLQSSAFGGGYLDQEKIEYNKDIKRETYTSLADWKEEQAKKPPVNGFSKQDSFKVKQKDLSSQVFEQTDYTEHLPLTKQSSDAILRKKFEA